MKKIYLFLFAAATAFTSIGQTIPNGDMEIWHNSTAGSSPAMNIFAPNSWYGFDSTIIEDGQAFGALFGAGNDWKVQLFKETDTVHGGTASAKLITAKQDTFGHIGAIMSNALINLDFAAISGGADPFTAITFTGGTATTLRITNVSSWVNYKPGKDSVTGLFGGNDTAMITVQAICTAYGNDSVIGAGASMISATAGFMQVNTPIAYIDTYSTCDLVRIIYASSALGGPSLDSSVLYVDDVTMSGITQHSHVAVNHVATAKNVVTVYPNPATGTLYLSGLQNAGLTVTMVAVNGQVVKTQALQGNDAVSLQGVAPGLYLYSITDNKGATVQKGKVTVQ